MSLSRRQLLQAASGASLGVVAGGPLRRTRAAAQSGEKEAVTIQFWTHDQNYIDFFTARAAELTESADSAYASGSGVPDAIGIEISQFSRFMQRGVAEQTLLDLTDRIADVRDQFFESRWAPYTVDGKVYAVESGYPLSVYYYRQDLFEEYGIETPIESWDDLMEIGRTVTVPKGKAVAAVSTTGGTGGGDITHFGLLYQQRGGSFFDAEGNLTLDTPEAVEVADFIATVLQEKTILGLSDFYGGPGAAALQQAATVGYFMPDWFQTYVIEPTAPEQ